MVFPGHDYKGDTVSTIGEERAFNPRLQVKSVDEYVALMNGLNLSNPKMMDVAVPANIHQGLTQKRIAEQGWAVTAQDAIGIIAHPDVVLIDLRKKTNAPAWRNSRHAASALSRLTGKHHRRWCAADFGRDDEQNSAVLLCFRRTLCHGGTGVAGCRAEKRAAY